MVEWKELLVKVKVTLYTLDRTTAGGTTEREDQIKGVSRRIWGNAKKAERGKKPTAGVYKRATG